MDFLTKILLLCLLGLSITCGYYIYKSNKYESASLIYKNNYEVSQDSIKIYQLKNDELMYTHGSYILNIEELENIIGIKEDYIKDIEKKLDNNVLYISNIESQIIIKDSLINSQVIERDTINNTVSSGFDFTNEWYSINGKVSIYDTYIESTVNSVEMNTPLTVGLTEDWRIFVNTDNPYININNISGAMLDPDKYTEKQSKIQLGIQGGYYFIYDDGIKNGPGIGVGLNIKLW